MKKIRNMGICVIDGKNKLSFIRISKEGKVSKLESYTIWKKYKKLYKCYHLLFKSIDVGLR